MSWLAVFAACLPTQPLDMEMAPEADLGSLVGIWETQEGKIVSVDTSDYNHLAVSYWNLVQKILPVEVLNQFSVSLHLFTDGADGVLAAMSPQNDSNTVWRILIDTVDVDVHTKDSLKVLDYTHTIVHEFGHLLTLNNTQIQATDDVVQNDRMGYLTSEGYARPDSYLGQFVEQFWKGKYLAAWDRINFINTEEKRLRALDRFYFKNQERHVTAYSSESPEEDIAEAWTFFVLDEKPTEDGVRYDKVRFFISLKSW